MTTDQPDDPAGVSFFASGPFIRALDAAAAERGETRSHFVRKALADVLRSAGLLDPQAPVTRHEARRRALSTRGQSR
ncbi:MAG: hypothetical protein MIN69_13745 [Methylorubrum extorquens]|jgi:hypothetical protein|uniref:hypothetical protein n=1 Tax=Methylorubrum extorquens TaxID=408 RepID=UPI002FEE655B